MLRLSDNNTPKDLAIRNRVDGSRLAIDGIDRARQALEALTPPALDQRATRLQRCTRERIDKREGT
jgi:hypothetical protein